MGGLLSNFGGSVPDPEKRKAGAPLGTTMPACNPFAVKMRQQETIRMLLEGVKIQRIADILGIHVATVHSYIRDPEVRAQIVTLNSTLLNTLDEDLTVRFQTKAERMDDMATLALNEMKKLLEDPSTHIGIKAKMIDSALDRCPEVSRTKKLDVTTKSFTMKAEDLLAAAQAARDIEQKAQAIEVATDSEQNSVRD